MEWGAEQSRTERFRRQFEKVKEFEILHRGLSGLSCWLYYNVFQKSEAAELNADKMNLASLIDSQFSWRNEGVNTWELYQVLSGSSDCNFFLLTWWNLDPDPCTGVGTVSLLGHF